MKYLAAAIMLLFAVFPCWAEMTDDVAPPESLADLRYLTEEYYPYNYTESGELKGISTEILRMVWDDLGVPRQPITSLPWARGYEMVQQDRNTVLYTMAYDPEREHLFLWAGPILTVRFVLIARKSKGIRLRSLEDVEGYRIGTLREDISDLLLEQYKTLATVEPVAAMETNVDKLVDDRLDMVAYEEASWIRLAVKMDLSPDDFETVYVLSETPVYYAFHPETPPSLVAQFQEGLDTVKASPAYRKLLDKYLY